MSCHHKEVASPSLVRPHVPVGELEPIPGIQPESVVTPRNPFVEPGRHALPHLPKYSLGAIRFVQIQWRKDAYIALSSRRQHNLCMTIVTLLTHTACGIGFSPKACGMSGTTRATTPWLSLICSTDRSANQLARKPLVSYKNEAVDAKASKSPVQPRLGNASADDRQADRLTARPSAGSPLVGPQSYLSSCGRRCRAACSPRRASR